MAGEPGYSSASISIERQEGHDIVLTEIGQAYEDYVEGSLYAWTCPGAGIMYFDGTTTHPIEDDTLYTDTPNPTTSSQLYLADGTPVRLVDIWAPGSPTILTGESITSANSSTLSIYFSD